MGGCHLFPQSLLVAVGGHRLVGVVISTHSRRLCAWQSSSLRADAASACNNHRLYWRAIAQPLPMDGCCSHVDPAYCSRKVTMAAAAYTRPLPTIHGRYRYARILVVTILYVVAEVSAWLGPIRVCKTGNVDPSRLERIDGESDHVRLCQPVHPLEELAQGVARAGDRWPLE
ncbi:hypothetical protein GW17_00033260 [Ensete ventricosum]|nr:hypothetical protein GW17_00033260 [Ensete ventricosum]RZS19592.1 hypothetical protein BHM03_00052011 [Ensete ventricosum]